MQQFKMENSISTIFSEETNLKNIQKYLFNQILFFQKDSILYAKGNDPKGFYYIIKGKVKISKIFKTKKTQATASHGNILGIEEFIKGTKYTSSATIIEDSTICFVSASVLASIFKQHPNLFFELLKNLYQNLLKSEKKIFQSAIEDIEENLSKIFNPANNALIKKQLTAYSKKRENVTNRYSVKKPAKKENYFRLKIKQLIY